MPRKKAQPTKRQKFTREYKLEAVRLSLQGTKSVAAVAADLGIDTHQLYRWRRALAEEGGGAFPGNGKMTSQDTSQDEELHQLRRQLKQVTEERDFLRKATASSPRNLVEICLHSCSRWTVPREHDVPLARGVEGRLLRFPRSARVRTCALQ